MTRSAVTGHFLRSTAGEIFLLARHPQEPSGCTLVVPPFAEEMNKCRRMVTETALELCAAGQAMLVPDLYGTGDSGGDFREARWSSWEQDLGTVCAWGAQNGLPVTSVIAIRLGAALTVAAARNGRIPELRATVFWQPVLDGAKYLTYFLRLRTAAMLLAEDRKETVAELRARLASGERIEVAGYEISGDLAADLERLTPSPDRLGGLGTIHWMEVGRSPESALPGSSAAVIERMRASGARVVPHGLIGEPFWATVEIACVREMIRETVHSLTGISSVDSDER